MMQSGTSSQMVCYKSKEEAVRLLTTYNPSEQVKFARFPERCVCGSAPTLAKIKAEYGEEVMVKWLVIELNDYNNFVGVKEENKNSLEVMKEVAQMIYNRYYHLKLSEVMLFFQRLKYGDYGEMYGSVDAVRILRAFKNFMYDRNRIIDKVAQEEREKAEAESRKNAITRAQWEEIKKKRIK